MTPGGGDANRCGSSSRETDVHLDGDSDTEAYLCSSSEEDTDGDVVVSSSWGEDDDEASIASVCHWTQIDSKNFPSNAPPEFLGFLTSLDVFNLIATPCLICLFHSNFKVRYCTQLC